MDDTGLLRGELTFRQLGHFVAVAEVGSIAGAAQRLQFSPSAVSASISELERALGAQLCIRRRAQGVTLTPTGSLVLLRAKRLLADVAELNHAVHGGGELVGPLVVGCFHSLAPTLLPSLLEEFERRHPRVSIDFVVGAQDELQHDIISGRIDAALMYDMSGTEQLGRATLFQTRCSVRRTRSPSRTPSPSRSSPRFPSCSTTRCRAPITPRPCSKRGGSCRTSATARTRSS